MVSVHGRGTAEGIPHWNRLPFALHTGVVPADADGKKEMGVKCLEDIEKKYRHAILVLQAISQRSGCYKDGSCDEWSEAAAFGDCGRAAEKALKYLGEQTVMPNKAKKRNGAVE